jgi:hypothetical protein
MAARQTRHGCNLKASEWYHFILKSRRARGGAGRAADVA